MVRKYTFWNEEMLDFIRRNFDKLTNKEIAVKLGTNEDSIKNACKWYKIKKDGGTIIKNKYKRGILICPNKGKKCPSTTKKNLENNPMNNPKTVEKMRKTKIRLYNEGEIKAWNDGLTKETDERIKRSGENLSKTRKHMFKEGLLNASGENNGMFGKIPWNKNKKFPQFSGKNNSNWRGGKSFEPYGMKFNNELKEKIRERDNYECQYCTKKQEREKLDVHHIDYNKKNNSKINLISLCKKCHGKANFNRKHWTRYFQMQMFIKALFNPENLLIFNENKQLIGIK